MGFIHLKVDIFILATAYPSFTVRAGMGRKVACYCGQGRKQLGLGCSSSHSYVDVWKGFCDSCPKTTHLSSLTMNRARVTSWGGGESCFHWVKKSHQLLFIQTGLCLSYVIIPLSWDPYPLSSFMKWLLSAPAAYIRQLMQMDYFLCQNCALLW